LGSWLGGLFPSYEEKKLKKKGRGKKVGLATEKKSQGVGIMKVAL